MIHIVVVDQIHKGIYWSSMSMCWDVTFFYTSTLVLCFLLYFIVFICSRIFISCSFEPGLLHSSLAGLEVSLRNVWVGKKSFLHDSLSFFGLGSPNLESFTLSSVSVSRNHVSFFFFTWRPKVWVGPRMWAQLTPYYCIFLQLLCIFMIPCGLLNWSRRGDVDFCRPPKAQFMTQMCKAGEPNELLLYYFRSQKSNIVTISAADEHYQKQKGGREGGPWN